MNNLTYINIHKDLLFHLMEQIVHLILIQIVIEFQINVNFHLSFLSLVLL